MQVAIGTDLATALRALRCFDEVVKGESDRTCESPPKKRRKVEEMKGEGRLMEEIRLTTWNVYNPVNNGIFSISTGAGFLPSTG